jgi:hypothetical protein
LYNQTILYGGGAILVRQFCSSALAKYVFPQPVGPVMITVNGCRKRNPFSTSLAVVVVVDTHDDSVETVDWFRVCFENV